MLFHDIPYYTITILSHAILYHTILYYTILSHATLYYTIPYNTIHHGVSPAVLLPPSTRVQDTIVV